MNDTTIYGKDDCQECKVCYHNRATVKEKRGARGKQQNFELRVPICRSVPLNCCSERPLALIGPLALLLLRRL